MFKEAESRPDKIESTSNNVQVRKKQQRSNSIPYRQSNFLQKVLCPDDTSDDGQEGGRDTTTKKPTNIKTRKRFFRKNQ